MVKKKQQQKAPATLLLREELLVKINVSKAQMKSYMKDGLPHYLIGSEFRFLENEVLTWLESYQPSQERLESEFRDKKGRSLKDYVSGEIILKTLRITKENLVSQCKKGMPFETVGTRDYFQLQDILDYYRKGSERASTSSKTSTSTSATSTKASTPKRSSKKKYLMPLCTNIAREVPFIIVDGSYHFSNFKAGTGLVLVENRDKVTGISNVRNIKTTKPIVCEFVAILDALRMIKQKKMNKAIIVTDQETWTKGIVLDENTYEVAVKPYIKELNRLWSELRGKVTINFVGEMNNGKQNILHKKAHTLSREYKKDLIEELELE